MFYSAACDTEVRPVLVLSLYRFTPLRSLAAVIGAAEQVGCASSSLRAHSANYKDIKIDE